MGGLKICLYSAENIREATQSILKIDGRIPPEIATTLRETAQFDHDWHVKKGDRGIPPVSKKYQPRVRGERG